MHTYIRECSEKYLASPPLLPLSHQIFFIDNDDDDDDALLYSQQRIRLYILDFVSFLYHGISYNVELQVYSVTC
jgi:hypothetical protein